MRYKLLGKSGLRVSELSLGTMTFGEDWGWGASKEESRKMFDRYAQAGGNFIDTSINYTNGTSETFTGEFIHSDRDHFVVATKYTLSTRPDDPNASGNARKNMMRSLETSLKRLQTDYIDLYYLHMWDFTTPVDEVMRAMDDAVRAGKILYPAVSDTPAWVVAKANTKADLMGWAPFTALQAPYALSWRDLERELLPMAADMELAVCVWGIVGGGLLTGKFAQEVTPGSTRIDPSRITERRRAQVETVRQVAEECGRSPAQVAINWVRQQQHKAQIIPILGARTEAQLRDNLGVLEWELSPEQIERLEQACPIELGFPHGFLEDNELIYGEKHALLENHHVRGWPWLGAK